MSRFSFLFFILGALLRASVGEASPLPIFVTAQCSIQCKTETSARVIFSGKGIFNPQTSLRKVANGGMPPLLTQRLSLLGDDLCLAAAEKTCGDKNAIIQLKPLSLRSLRWQAPLPFDCSQKRGCILSPYDAHFKNQLAYAPSAGPLADELRFSTIPPSPLAQCHHSIRAKACYGDCTSNHPACSGTGDYVDTLLTPEYFGKSKEVMCADGLERFLSSARTPRALRPMLCRRYFFEQLVLQKNQNLSCAAIRFTIPDCDQF